MDSIWQLDSQEWTVEELLDPSHDPIFSLFYDKSQLLFSSTSDPDSTDVVVPDPDPTEDLTSMPSATPSIDTANTDLSRPMLERWLEQSLASSLPPGATQQAFDIGLHGLDYPLCSISPEVVSLISVNVLYHVHKQYGCLPTRISPVDYEAPLSTYLIELPSASSSSSLRVTVSWPNVQRRTMISQNRFGTKSLTIPASFGYEHPVSFNVKTYLHNNLQLRRMGIADPCPAQQDTSASFKNQTLAPFDMWPSAIYSTTPLDKITSQDIELSRGAWASIRCIKPQYQFPSSNLPERAKQSSDNVPLFLSQRDTGCGEGLERFEPTLLMKRFERWRVKVQDEQYLPDDDLDSDLGALDLDEDLRLLEEEGEFLFKNQMDIEDYKSLCERHGLQRMLKTSVGEGGAADDVMDQFLRKEYDDITTTLTVCDDQEASLDDIGASDMLLAGQGPIMDLPRTVGWTACNADVLSSTSKDPGRTIVDPDFVLEQDLAGSNGKSVRGTLKQIWPRLDGAQQRRLLGVLARLLVAIWDNFDILDDDQRDVTTTQQELSHGKANLSLGDQEDIHCQTRPDVSGPWTKQDLANQTATPSISDRRSAEERLRLLEDEFMNQSFLDAVREANKPVQPLSVEHSGQGVNGQLSRSPRNLRTVSATSSSRSSVETAHPPWNLDDIDTAQRMTTTRAGAKESHFAQDRTFILPLHPADTLECGSIRSLDFSLDDLLIQADIRQESTASSSPLLQEPKIVGVSRWKCIGPRPTSTPFIPPPKELFPRSINVFQTTAQRSSYPLVHLFSLPDVFCPVQFGGQEQVEEKKAQEGLAHVLARSLAKQRPLAAEFLTEEVENKEQRMYHRWMAAWHERSPRAPKATRMRYDMMKILRQHVLEGSMRLFGQAQGDDDRGDRQYYYDQGDGGRREEWQGSIPQTGSSSPLQQQPENKEGADFTTAPSSAHCSKCRDEWNEQERTRQEKKQFHEACKVWDKLIVDESHYRHGKDKQKQKHGCRQNRTADDAQQTQWGQVGKEEAIMTLGLGLSYAQQHSLTHFLGLGLGLGLGVGVGMGNFTSAFVGVKGVNHHGYDHTEDGPTTGAMTETMPRTHPWRLTEEEQAIVEAHLWGAMRQRRSDHQHWGERGEP